MSFRPIYLLLTFLIVVFLLIGGLLYLPQLSEATGSIDAEHPTLFVAGTPVTASYPIKIIALLFGAMVVGIFLVFVFIGAKKTDKVLSKKINKTLAVGAVLYVGVYFAMVMSWWQYTASNSFDYFLGLPKPTAWMMFGLLIIPFFMSYFYITHFNEWIYNAEDEAKFKAIVQRRKSKSIQ